MQRVNLNLNFLHLLGGRAATSCESLGLLLPRRVGCVVSHPAPPPTSWEAQGGQPLLSNLNCLTHETGLRTV